MYIRYCSFPCLYDICPTGGVRYGYQRESHVSGVAPVWRDWRYRVILNVSGPVERFFTSVGSTSGTIRHENDAADGPAFRIEFSTIGEIV